MSWVLVVVTTFLSTVQYYRWVCRVCRAEKRCQTCCSPQIVAATDSFRAVVANQSRTTSAKGDPFESMVIANLFHRFRNVTVKELIVRLTDIPQADIPAWCDSVRMPDWDVVFAQSDDLLAKSDVEYFRRESTSVCLRPKISFRPGKHAHPCFVNFVLS